VLFASFGARQLIVTDFDKHFLSAMLMPESWPQENADLANGVWHRNYAWFREMMTGRNELI
jgi:hypothetical protein